MVSPTGYKKCLICSKEFPYREQFVSRGHYGIASKKSKYCSHKCLYQSVSNRNKTYIPTPEARRRMVDGLRKKIKGVKLSPEVCRARSERLKGSKSHFWKGGKTRESVILRNSVEFSIWRNAVYERDDYTCQQCKQRGGKLNAHHIKSWSQYPELRFEVSNGLTLCVPCHKKTDTYLRNYPKSNRMSLEAQINAIKKIK